MKTINELLKERKLLLKVLAIKRLSTNQYSTAYYQLSQKINKLR